MDFDAEIKELEDKLNRCYMDYPVWDFPWARAAYLMEDISILKRKKALALLSGEVRS
jgi:hypothetical protein